MENSGKMNGKEEKRKITRLFEKLKEVLKNKDERQVKARLALVASFSLTAAIAYLIGGVELFFGSFPIFIALAMSNKDKLLGVSAGLFILLLSRGVPIIYGFVFVAVLLIRILAYLLPRIFESEDYEDGEGAALVRYEDKKPVLKKNKNKTVVHISDAPPESSEASAQKLSQDASEGVSGSEKEAPTEAKAALFCEGWRLSLLCAAIGGLLCGIFILVENDFSLYSFLTTLALTALAPLFLLAIGGFFGNQYTAREWYSLLSVALIITLCVYSSIDKSFIGMPMAPFLSMLLTLCVCLGGGLVRGACVAILCGLTFDIIYLPLLLLAALLFCLVSSIKKNGGIVAVCALIVIWCYYIGGERGLVGVLPPMLLAIPFYMIYDKYRELMLSPMRAAAAGGLYFAQAVTEKTKNQAVRERLGALSDAFSSLSEVFYKLSDRFRRPDILGIKRIAESAFEDNCRGCRNRELCWGADYSKTLDAVKCVTSSLHSKGTVTKDCLPDEFESRCIRLEKIINDVNLSISQATEKIIKGERIGLFSSSYDDITAILKDALENDGEEYECDTATAERIFEYLCSLELDVGGVVVYGKRCKHIVAKGISLSEGLSGNKISEICKKISQIVGQELTEPVFEVGKDGSLMLLYSRPEVRALCAHGRLPSKELSDMQMDEGELYVNPFSDEGEMCGDMTDAFITDTSYFYSLISDGMGSGEEAAFTSGVCAMFIEKMLSAGNRADITLRMLNNVIRSENMGCGSECSATVDLLELDLMSGVASFIKSGAAPTYILRGSTVYKISSRTMPVGIIKDADARITKFDTMKGDLIVMISDGCCPDSEDCSWLVDYLCQKMPIHFGGENQSGLCESIKNEILDEAVKNFPADKDRDDISVSVVLVCD